jgi:hypothetical protein
MMQEWLGNVVDNEPEKAVAWYLDNQKKLLFWYRNRARYDHALQG